MILGRTGLIIGLHQSVHPAHVLLQVLLRPALRGAQPARGRRRGLVHVVGRLHVQRQRRVQPVTLIAQPARIRPGGIVHQLMLEQGGILGESPAAIRMLARVGSLSGVDAFVVLEVGVRSEGLLADGAAVWPFSRVRAAVHLEDVGGGEGLVASGRVAAEGALAGVRAQVLVGVPARLERLAARGALVRPVARVNAGVGLQAVLGGERFAASLLRAKKRLLIVIAVYVVRLFVRF